MSVDPVTEEPPMPADGGPLRLVQVGAGAMGRAWLAVVTASADIELVGLVDLDEGAAARAAAEVGRPDLARATSLADLLARVDADAVVDVTVPEAHAEVSTVALLAGLDVLCEKPAAPTVSQALSMAAAAEVTGRLLMISQSRRYWRDLVALRAQLGPLRPLGVVSCQFFRAPHFGGFRDSMPHPLLVDMAIHQFDLARDLVGSEPAWISCTSWNPGWSWYAGDAAAQVEAGFADGTRFTFTGSWCSPGLETSWNGDWRLSGAGGTALWDGDHPPVAQTSDGADVPAERGTGPEGIGGALAEFVTAVRGRTSGGPVPSGEVHSNVMSLAMVEGAVRSAQSGQRVRIADLLEEAHAEAVAREQRPALRAVLTSWPSVLAVVGTPHR